MNPPDAINRLNAALEGRYRIESELGEGGMATVYLADDLKHERKVALKVLKPELAAVVGAERFLAEIKTTANLQHPHILPLFDSGEADTFLFYVMPYVEGESLRDKLDREHQLPVDDAVRIASDVAEALEYAHGHGVIHRDIKPANILIHSGRPVISDFGIALAVGAAGGGRLTETGLSLGTPHYMSPEQATGDMNVGPATDIYALGCVLYEMLVGEPPFTGSTAQAVLGKIVTGSADSVTEHRATVPANIEAAISKALEKVPADRFAGAQGLAQALADHAFRHHEAADPRDASWWAMWNPLSVSSTAAVVLLLLLTGLSRLGQEEEARIVSQFEVALPEGVQSVGRLGGDISPDGDNLLFVGSAIGETRRIWLRARGQLVAAPIPGTELGFNPRFSPDGESVAFTAAGALKTVPISGGGTRTVVADSVSNGGIAWDDDQMLYFAKPGSGIWRVPAAGGEQEEVTVLAEGDSAHLWPESLPNGAGVLFSRTRGGGTNEIAVLPSREGRVLSLFTGTLARYAASGHILWTSDDGTLLGAPFDADHPDEVAPGVTLVEGVGMEGGGYFALSGNGDLLYRPAGLRRGGIPVWVGRDGSERLVDPRLTDVFRDPAVSPDGRRIAFEAGPEVRREIRVYDSDQGTLTPVTFDKDSRRPFWTTDGREVGFYSRDAAERGWYSQVADLSGPARLLLRAEVMGVAWWTPDGAALAYSESGDLMYAAAHPDSAGRQLTTTAFRERAPALSRDGRWMAYQSDESGQVEVYVRPFPGPGGRTLVSRDGGWTPVWAHSGNELFYVRPNDLTMMVATVRTDSVFTVESRRPLMSWNRFYIAGGGRHFDISPDDRELLALRVSDTAPHVLVLNFFEELRRLVPN